MLLELLAAEAVLAFIHGSRQSPALPNGSVPHPLLLPPLALLLRRTRHKHVIQRVVVTICLPHHLESRVQEKWWWWRWEWGRTRRQWESTFQQRSDHSGQIWGEICYMCCVMLICASVALLKLLSLYINSVRQERVSTLPFPCPSLIAMATKQQVETAVCKGVRGNMKCIYDSLCRRVFVRESKNCIRLVTVWEGVRVRSCLCLHAHKDSTSACAWGVGFHTDACTQKQRLVRHHTLIPSPSRS